MPIEYSGIIDEHLTVCNAVGVFDVSHMGEFWVKGSNAVSYTHLDVYKRQNNERPTEPRTYRNYYNNLMVKLNIPKLKYHGLRHSFATPVSYTHLDVYKRQVHQRKSSTICLVCLIALQLKFDFYPFCLQYI